MAVASISVHFRQVSPSASRKTFLGTIAVVEESLNAVISKMPLALQDPWQKLNIAEDLEVGRKK